MNTIVKISISILTYNRCELLCKLLGKLNYLKYRPLEIIVVDNHSLDATNFEVTKKFPNVIYIRTKNNIGVAARNIGIAAATGDIVVTLDDDINGIDDRDIKNLLLAFSENQSLGALNFKVLDVKGNITNWVHHRAKEKYHDQDFLTYEITEGAVAFRREILEKTGYYFNMFFISHEGPDLAFRIFDQGYQVQYTGKIKVIHFHSEIGRQPWRRYYYDTRNQLWLAARNFPPSYAISFLSRGLVSMMIYSIRDGYFNYWAAGIRDGFKGMKDVMEERVVLNSRTMEIIRRIDRKRPNLIYMIKNRFFKRGVNI